MRHVPHLYLPAPWNETRLHPAVEQSRHLRTVLRMRSGEPVSYTDGEGTVGTGTLADDGVERGDEHRPSPTPPLLTLVVAPPSSRERCRFLVEKCAEIGVSRLHWTTTAHSEGRPPSAAKARAWAVSALEQSRGAWLMETGAVALRDLDPTELVVADPGGSSVPPTGRGTLLVGPEGGLAPDEIPPGAARLALGPTVLRTETAAVVASFVLLTRPGGL